MKAEALLPASAGGAIDDCGIAARSIHCLYQRNFDRA
jgi:hypothetical protein